MSQAECAKFNVFAWSAPVILRYSKVLQSRGSGFGSGCWADLHSRRRPSNHVEQKLDSQPARLPPAGGLGDDASHDSVECFALRTRRL